MCRPQFKNQHCGDALRGLELHALDNYRELRYDFKLRPGKHRLSKNQRYSTAPNVWRRSAEVENMIKWAFKWPEARQSRLTTS